ncbi:MAG: DUF3027 domain-containing protein [Actinobacteria bacterium]|nr:DUF3027 domain-containing protein [Actinomycetota bacterium]
MAWSKKSAGSFGALDLARAALLEGETKYVGDFICEDVDTEGRMASYLFEASLPGYKGWRWVVTAIKVEEESEPTICDVVLLPGPDSLLAPDWIPYADRIQPGDIGVGDILPSSADDTRLVPGFAALPDGEELDEVPFWELGLGRARVISIEGRDQASKRWYTGDYGPDSPIAKAAPKPCHSCGFFISIAGSLRGAFGVCANSISPQDGHVVSVDHGCGAHSEVTL